MTPNLINVYALVDVTNTYKFIWFGARYVTNSCEFIKFGANTFIRFGARYVTKPYEFIWFGAMNVTKPISIYRLWGHG
jgi:hypothetical protein